MTAYTRDCAVSVTVTPTAAAAAAFKGAATVSVLLEALPRGVWFTTYEDETGTLKPIYLAEWYKGRNVEQLNRKIKYSRKFLVHGTFETTDCLDIGPQIGDYDDVITTMIVASRKLSWYGQGGGESDIVAIDVDYESPDEPQNEGGEAADGTFTYEFTSESDHVDTALAQTSDGKQPEAGEGLLINFDGKDVGGVDIESPVEELNEIHPFTEADFNPGFRQQLRDSVAKVNLNDWREFASGEVLFAGASASKKGKIWYVSFRFRIRRNRHASTNSAIDFTVVNGGVPQVVHVDKLGWEYLWVKMESAPVFDAAGNRDETKRQVAPASVNVAKVYDYLDFATLGIGTSPMK